MFVLTLLADTIRIPPQLLSKPTATSVTTEIEKRYPNKIIVDVGLIICPYGPPLEIGHGMLVPSDGGAHHQVIFQCVVFRPFVEEVLIGIVTQSHEDGIKVSVGGFFDHVFIPAYWMLNPSTFDESVGLWGWDPYDNEEEEGAQEEEAQEEEEGGIKTEAADDEEELGEEIADGEEGKGSVEEKPDGEEEKGSNRYEIGIGSIMRFKVKAVNFTRITTTMKGVQATTTTTSHTPDRAFGLNGSSSGANRASVKTEDDEDGAVRRRRSSSDLSDADHHPAPMQIVGSICEDGLGLIEWWNSPAEESEDEEDEGNGDEEDEESGDDS